MKKIGTVLTGKVYEIKCQYPCIRKLEKRLHVVKRELNRDCARHK